MGASVIFGLPNNYLDTFKSSRPEVFCRKSVLKNFAKLTGKHLGQSLFFNEVAGLGRQVFSYEFCEISKNIFSYRTPPVSASAPSSSLKTCRVEIFSKNVYTRHFLFIFTQFQKQPFRGVLRKRCSENMRQNCRRTRMSKCDLNKWVSTRKFAAYFQNTFS